MDEQAVSVEGRRGLGRVEFCRKHRLSLSTLARYRRRRAQAAAAPTSHWLAVEVSGGDAALETGACSGLALALAGGRRIEIGRGFDARTLRQLMSALEGI